MLHILCYTTDCAAKSALAGPRGGPVSAEQGTLPPPWSPARKFPPAPQLPVLKIQMDYFSSLVNYLV